MADPINSGSAPPLPADDARRRPVEHQDTVLLSDLPPDPSQVAPAIAPSREPSDATLSSEHLSQQAAAALSQRYEVLAAAGHGSMGNVYKARDLETGEIVALKLLKPEIASDQAMMERFKNELLFARKITHKNVCRVYEFNRVGGIAYTSMEFVEGDSLRGVLNRFGGLPIRKATDLVLQICSGLKEAHAQGIVHRDLKPENVMIDAAGNVKIMDFGIARSMEAGTRLTGSMVGTPAYMAPEQVAGKSVDYRTDIYSLGLILYEIFTGTPAFQAENAVAVALKQMRESPTPPHEIDPNVPVGIERAILKALEKEPAKRFQSIAELENALRAPRPQAATATLADIPFNRTSQSSGASQPLHGAANKKRSSGGIWVLVFFILALAVLGALRGAQLKKFAETLRPPAPLPTPPPPNFALGSPSTQDSNAATGAVTTTQAPSAAAQTSPGSGQTDATQNSSDTTNTALPADAKTPVAKKAPTVEPPADTDNQPEDDTDSTIIDSARPNSRAQAPPAKPAATTDSQQTINAADGTSTTGDPAAGNDAQSYIWVGRFEKQERAQSTADRIRGAGFTPQIVTRHNENGQFFVVVAGPYPDSVIPGLLQRLKGQGFLIAHKVPAGFVPKQNPSH
jgi:serine/threonine protein kinase